LCCSFSSPALYHDRFGYRNQILKSVIRNDDGVDASARSRAQVSPFLRHMAIDDHVVDYSGAPFKWDEEVL
jgi:hypothetical protein